LSTVSLNPSGCDRQLPRLGPARNEYDVEHRRRSAVLEYRVSVTCDYPKSVIYVISISLHRRSGEVDWTDLLEEMTRCIVRAKVQEIDKEHV
jgi:hypothetical protein